MISPGHLCLFEKKVDLKNCNHKGLFRSKYHRIIFLNLQPETGELRISKSKTEKSLEKTNPMGITTVRLKYRSIICKEVELFRGIPVWRFLQGIPVQIEDFDQSEV